LFFLRAFGWRILLTWTSDWGPSISDIPFSAWQTRLRTNLWLSTLLVAGLTALAVALRMAIGAWIGVAGLVMFLPFIFAIAYLSGPRWGYIALALVSVLTWLFVLKPSLSFDVLPRRQITDVALMIVSGIGVVEFVRLLGRALRNLQKERDQSKALLRELYHRTGNNFQMVSSMLALVRRAMTDQSAKKALLDAGERVTALGIVQRQLATSVEGNVDLKLLLPELFAEFERPLGVRIEFKNEDVGQVAGGLPPLWRLSPMS
jgi:K+-sensing histidine kinase KdpD